MGYLLPSILMVNAAWNVLVWPQFMIRVKKDKRSRDDLGKVTRFFVVHVLLVSVSLVIAFVSFVTALAAILS
ncbi:SCO4848 family membrane protein [Tropheryma whipplei]|uniref:SCO4848 family membrane protein n=1 Tax=Tropheryma whipplei TaxID=2039 RepID=UPI000000C82D|nr:hypothetical protein [Tropheryma whipplei]MCO8182332.1 hypothetical protein [Tropheryma whipplei]MCO8190101.1 hypothetical protein [Tropheryma whipplei]CAD67034.1 putative integral membrane protein [Tropheryma whipplei TW08/27]